MFTLMEICEYRAEMAAYSYFRWRFNRWEVSFFRETRGLFQFRINLPYIHLSNTLLRQVVSRGIDPQYYTEALIGGKVFGKEIGNAKSV